jgi:6,7-dimethyl-8-ribityllumazine synthase
MATGFPKPRDLPRLTDARIAVVAARFNGHIADELLRGCIERLGELGVTAPQFVERVPGAFELPVAAKLLADRKDIEAVICLGCVIRGDTPHFDYVAGECARGVQQVAVSSGKPVIFGVLTTNTEQQALDRAGGSHSHAGRNAADVAVEMIAFCRGARA